MQKNKTILCDVDGTILDFANPFHDWMNSRGFTTIEGKHLTEVFLISEVFECTDDEHQKEVEAFSDSEMFSKLPALRGAQEAIENLRSKGWHIVAITSCHRSPAARASRIDNLKSVFGFEEEDIVFAGKMAPKLEILKKYDPTIWVEDCMFHAKEGLAAGHQPILIDREYNRHEDMSDTDSIEHIIVRVDDWTQLEDYIEGIK